MATITPGFVPGVLTGGSDNDILIPGPGFNLLDGGSGTDTAEFPILLNQAFQISPDAPPPPPQFIQFPGTVSGPGFDDTLFSIEVLQFIDGSLATDPSTPAAQVVRLYQAALGRPPDPAGLAGWVDALNNGTPLLTIAQGFLGSGEFQSRFPGAVTNSASFVAQLYQNVLHRAPDAAGQSGWVNALNSGQQSQAQVLVGFSESAENQSNTSAAVDAGIWVPNEAAAGVARLYYSALGRAPDAAGLIGWTSQIQSGAMSLFDEAGAFSSSSEFTSKYGTLSNADFVSLLYKNVLNRSADPAGLNAWVNALNSGGATRAGVLIGFSESPEHQAILAPVIDNRGIVTSG